MATKIITVAAVPPAESSGADYNKAAPLNAVEFDQNLVNLRAAIDRRCLSTGNGGGAFSVGALTASGARHYFANIGGQSNINLNGATGNNSNVEFAENSVTKTILGYVPAISAWRLSQNGADAIVVNNSGNVLIGTPTDNGSGAKLQVMGAISSSQAGNNYLDINSNAESGIHLQNSGVSKWAIYNYNVGNVLNIYDHANAVVRASFTSTGLSVAGSISATGNIVGPSGYWIKTAATGSNYTGLYIDDNGVSTGVAKAVIAINNSFIAQISSTGLSVAGSISATGNIRFNSGNLTTPAISKDVGFEWVSDTTLRIYMRGTDSALRSVNLTLA